MTRVVLSPHLDDAVLSCWTRLRGALVVTVCTGDPAPGVRGGWDDVVGFPDGVTAMAARRAEDERALALAGAGRRHVGLLDEQYRAADADPAELCAQLLAWLRAEVGAVDELLAPAGIGDHADHLLTRQAAAAFATERGVALWLYADVPYAARGGWPSWVTAGGDPQAHTLDPPTLAAKQAAARAYVSQFDAIDADGGGDQLGPAVLGYEVRYPAG